MVVSVIPPFPTFTDRQGAPIDAGYIYCGTENLSPRSNLISIFSDVALTVALPNPVRTSGGFAVDASGNPTNIYASAQFSLAVADRNNVDRLTSPSYGFRVLAGAVTFDAVVINTSILPDAAGGAFNGTIALPWSSTVARDAQLRTASIYRTTQPAAAADLNKLDQLMVDVLGCRQTSSGAVAAMTNFKNTASITRNSAGVYTIVPIVALPTDFIVCAHAAAFSAGVTPLEVVCTTRSTTAPVISVRLNNVATDFAWDLVIKGNPAVADPIS
jgi:hypothetical protein